MRTEFTLFLTTFTTLLAIVNPLEALPVLPELMEGKGNAEHGQVVLQVLLLRDALVPAMLFLFFGVYLLKLFDVPMSMIRIAGGTCSHICIGFDLFAPSGSGGSIVAPSNPNANIAFMPLAIPLMFGPGAIATILGMTATVRQSHHEMLCLRRDRWRNSRNHAHHLSLPGLSQLLWRSGSAQPASMQPRALSAFWSRQSASASSSMA